MSKTTTSIPTGSKAVLVRNKLFAQQIIGTLLMYDGFGNLLGTLRTLELPLRDNVVDISAIPVGTYKCVQYLSKKYSTAVRIKRVVNRTDIIMHVGNYHWQTLGCVLCGQEIRDIDDNGLVDVTNSMAAMHEIRDTMMDIFVLTIVDTF